MRHLISPNFPIRGLHRLLTFRPRLSLSRPSPHSLSWQTGLFFVGFGDRMPEVEYAHPKQHQKAHDTAVTEPSQLLMSHEYELLCSAAIAHRLHRCWRIVKRSYSASYFTKHLIIVASVLPFLSSIRLCAAVAVVA